METVTFITKKRINELLKELEVGFVKQQKDTYHDVVYTNWEGKRYKGLRGGSIGPMTMTDMHRKHNCDVETKVKQKLNYYADSMYIENDQLNFDFRISEKQIRTLSFKWHLFGKYAHNQYDEGYQNYY